MHGPGRVPRNILCNDATLPVFQLLRSELKLAAFSNMLATRRRLVAAQLLRSELNLVAPVNMAPCNMRWRDPACTQIR